MSIKIMQRVWEHSQHKGTDLLTLLALADNANDDGYCWPGVSDHLAHKTRLSPRTVGLRIKGLARTTEVAVYPNPGTSHDYIITVGMSLSDVRKAIHAIAKKRGISTRELAVIRHEFRGGSEVSSDPEPAKKLRRGSEDGFGGGPKMGSDEPSVTVIESSSDEDEDDEPEIFVLYRYISGRDIIGDHQPERLLRMQANHSLSWVRDAFESAVNANAKNIIGYAETCLADWSENGHPDKRRKNGQKAPSSEEWARIADELEAEQQGQLSHEYTVYTGQEAIARRWWQTAQHELVRQLPRETYDAWLRNVPVLAVEGDAITIGLHTLQAREWVQHRLDKVIRRTLARIAGHDVEVKYTVLTGET